MGWWVADLLAENPAMLVSWVVWVIGSIVLHELAHGWAAIREGDDTPIHTGHMTWNPIVHMGWLSLGVFALTGLAWGAMPVNPSRFRGRYSDVIVPLAGPAMNVALAVVSGILAAVWSGYLQSVPDPMWSNVMQFFLVGAGLNLALAVFNLLPVPPLDGSKILAGLFQPYARLLEHPQAGMVSLILMVLLMTRLGGFITGPVFGAATNGISAVQSVLPGARPNLGVFKSFDGTPDMQQTATQMIALLKERPDYREMILEMERQGLTVEEQWERMRERLIEEVRQEGEGTGGGVE